MIRKVKKRIIKKSAKRYPASDIQNISLLADFGQKLTYSINVIRAKIIYQGGCDGRYLQR